MTTPHETWKFFDRLTIHQACSLFVGVDPHARDSKMLNAEIAFDRKISQQFDAIKELIVSAVLAQSIEAEVHAEILELNARPLQTIPGTIDIDRTYLRVPSLVAFLNQKRIANDFFGTVKDTVPAYLNRDNPCHSNKLAAAVRAWEFVVSDNKYQSQATPKKWIEKWLRENAVELGLTKADGSPNNSAIAEISKIVNWQQQGGAGKTAISKNTPRPKKRDR